MYAFEIRYRFEGMKTSRFVLKASSYGEAEERAKHKFEQDFGWSEREFDIYEIIKLGLAS